MSHPAQPPHAAQAPSEVQLKFYRQSFPHIGNFMVLGPSSNVYNCITWSVGLNDRWIDPGSRQQMATLYAHYFYVACGTAEADVDVYDVPDQPAKIDRKIKDTVKQIDNPLYNRITHAHRIDNLAQDHCSSKQQKMDLLQHGRHALEDGSPWNNKPAPSYGTIYGHFKKHDDHPSNPGKGGNNLPPVPKGPEHPDNALPGPVPVGHPAPHPAPPVPVNHPQPPSTLPKPAPRPTPGPSHPAPAPAPSHPAPAPSHPAPAPSHPAPAPSHPAPAPSHPAPAPSHPAPVPSHPAPAPTRPTSTRPSPPHSGGRKFVSHLALPKMAAYDAIPTPHVDAVASVQGVHTGLNNSYPDLVAEFDKLYAAWKATWHSGENEFSAHSTDRAQGPEFEALLHLGPKIIPLVVQKLTHPEDFMATGLYNALETDEAMKVDPNNILDYNVLQRQANLIVDLNHQRNKAVDSTVATWKEHQNNNALAAYSGVHTSGEAYDDLVSLGTGVIGNLMIEYHKEQDGWWHELLHHVVHGEKSGSGTFFKEHLFKTWQQWFEHQSHVEAPKGV